MPNFCHHGPAHRIGTAGFRRSAPQSGVALVEAVLWISLVLMPLLVSISEVSRALGDYRLIVQQVQAAARFLSTQVPGQGHAQARCIFLTGYPSLDCREAPLRPGFNGASFELVIQDASNSPQHRTQHTGSGGTTAGLVNLVSVTARGYEYPLWPSFIGSGSAHRGVRFEPIAATFRQMD